MVNLPASTAFNRRIPKQKFYDELQVSNKVMRLFTDQVVTIHWTHKLAPETLNVDAGKTVMEIQVIEIKLKDANISEDLLTLIDREIPYHLVFVIRYQDHGQLWIAYKDDAKNREGKFKVTQYYKTEWLPYDELNLRLEGPNLDQIYEGFLLQIAGDNLHKQEEEDLESAIKRAQEIEKLQKAIDKLRNKIPREKQFNQQVKLNGELRKLELELEMLEKWRA